MKKNVTKFFAGILLVAGAIDVVLKIRMRNLK